MESTQVNSKLLTVRQVAEATSLSEPFWRKVLLRGGIARIKAGRRVLIRRQDLEEWLSVRRQEATQ